MNPPSGNPTSSQDSKHIFVRTTRSVLDQSLSQVAIRHETSSKDKMNLILLSPVCAHSTDNHQHLTQVCPYWYWTILPHSPVGLSQGSGMGLLRETLVVNLLTLIMHSSSMMIEITCRTSAQGSENKQPPVLRLYSVGGSLQSTPCLRVLQIEQRSRSATKCRKHSCGCKSCE